MPMGVASGTKWQYVRPISRYGKSACLRFGLILFHLLQRRVGQRSPLGVSCGQGRQRARTTVMLSRALRSRARAMNRAHMSCMASVRAWSTRANMS